MNDSASPFPLVVSVLLDAIPTPVFLKDVGGHFIGVNRAYEDVTGLERSAMVGKTVYELYPVDLADRYAAADRVLYASSQQRQTYEVPMVGRDGARRDVFVSKSVFRDAQGAIAGLIGTFTDLTDQRRSEHALREVNERLEHRIGERTRDLARANALLTATLESTADGILAVDHRHEVVACNDRFLSLWGIDPTVSRTGSDEALLSSAVTRLRDPGAFLLRVNELYAGDDEAVDHVELADGRTFERYSMALRLVNEPAGRVWCFRDVTREHQLELEMRHAQKMEAVGRLAGGVAHDFNNLLTVILANAGIVADTLGEEHPALPDVAEIRTAGERAAELTRQLLTFSRKQLVVARRVDLNAVLQNMLRMLERLLGADVAIELRCGHDLGLINADPGQLEQVIANLCVNARDAMPGGGLLVLTTRRLTPSASGIVGLPMGGVELCVTDSGTGMSEAVREHIFEPFFTTKDRGKGTGLGLSTVYGIVKQGGGHIEVQTAPGQGTTFRITLPCAPEGSLVEEVSAPPQRALTGDASILLVEDEASLRRVLVPKPFQADTLLAKVSAVLAGRVEGD